ncbi:MAG TPA: alpha/beta fold hydrolase [Candidatus Acidoferrum sp.]
MKRSPLLLAGIGIGLLALGGLLTFVPSRRYAERRIIANAGSCRMDMTVVQLSGLPENSQNGSVVLFHGLSANKVIMTYLARAFAEAGLRVYVPDLAGHGQTAGPFTPDQAEACAKSFLRGLLAGGYIAPERTILAGHSMGAAIALRAAAKVRVAGVVAISPAPMANAHGVSPELLLYRNAPAVAPNTLIIVGTLEPLWLRANAADLAASSADGNTKFVLVPWNSHVSVLFSPAVARMAQQWAANVLHLPARAPVSLPFRGNLFGGFLGLLGILLISGPFLRETIGEKPVEEIAAAGKKLSEPRVVLEFALVSLSVVALLHYWMPLRALHLFEGDYLASFFLLSGLILVALHPREAKAKFRIKIAMLLSAAFAALVLHLLITGWVHLTIDGAWITLERWARFPLLFLASLLFLYGLEVVLGPVLEGAGRQRLLFGLGLLVVVWLALTAGVMWLHSGEILLVLLSPYFALFFVLSRMGAQLVRRHSGSAVAAALFGAILLAGFCLVLFPVS